MITATEAREKLDNMLISIEYILTEIEQRILFEISRGKSSTEFPVPDPFNMDLVIKELQSIGYTATRKPENEYPSVGILIISW